MKRGSTILPFVAKRNTKRGSYTLEAAIFLPLFIIGILTLGFTIRMVAISENLTFAATDEARQIATFAYHIPVAPLFAETLESRLIEENPAAAWVDVEGFRYLYESDDVDGLIAFRLTYWIGTGLPLGMVDGMEMTQHIKCRGFIGRTAEGTPISFDEMEKDTSASMVWVFPDGGEKYHTKSCTFVSSYPVQTVLSQGIRDRYDGCEKCDSADAEDGMQIYCFQSYGEAFHLYACPTVDKYVISMEKEQAEARGYAPCLKCGGIQ